MIILIHSNNSLLWHDSSRFWQTSQCARGHTHAVCIYSPKAWLSALLGGIWLPKQILSHHTLPTWKVSSLDLPPQANNCSSPLWLLQFPVPPWNSTWCPRNSVFHMKHCDLGCLFWTLLTLILIRNSSQKALSTVSLCTIQVLLTSGMTGLLCVEMVSRPMVSHTSMNGELLFPVGLGDLLKMSNWPW